MEVGLGEACSLAACRIAASVSGDSESLPLPRETEDGDEEAAPSLPLPLLLLLAACVFLSAWDGVLVVYCFRLSCCTLAAWRSDEAPFVDTCRL